MSLSWFCAFLFYLSFLQNAFFMNLVKNNICFSISLSQIQTDININVNICNVFWSFYAFLRQTPTFSSISLSFKFTKSLHVTSHYNILAVLFIQFNKFYLRKYVCILTMKLVGWNSLRKLNTWHAFLLFLAADVFH